MMSQCIVPSWNLSHQRQDLKLNNQGEEVNRSSHVDLDSHHNHFQQHQNFSQLVPMYVCFMFMYIYTSHWRLQSRVFVFVHNIIQTSSSLRDLSVLLYSRARSCSL